MLSVIIATYNGGTTLPRMLATFYEVKPPTTGYEIIVIDNGSTDNTRPILESFRKGLNLMILFEGRRGKSFALNRGIEAATGDLIVFTDDDVLVSPEWLQSFEQAADSHPDIGIFAGQVRHYWDSHPPKWLEHLASQGLSFAGTPIRLKQEPITPNQVKGVNMMVRRNVLGSIRFCVEEGVAFTGQNSSKGGEDTQFAAEVSRRSTPPLFVPSACVLHIVRSDQINISQVFLRYVRIGKAMGPFDASDGSTIFGYPRWAIRQTLKQIGRCLFHLVSGRITKASEEMVYLAMLIGRIIETKKNQDSLSRP